MYLILHLSIRFRNYTQEKLVKISLIYCFFITSINQSNVQQQAQLLQKIIDTCDSMGYVNHDAVYEDITECMQYEKNVKHFCYQDLLHYFCSDPVQSKSIFPFFSQHHQRVVENQNISFLNHIYISKYVIVKIDKNLLLINRHNFDFLEC